MSHASARLVRVLLAAFSLLTVALFAEPAEAYPWMIRHGFAQCGSCHTDPMGGETLTGFGRAASDSLLSTQWDGDDTPTSRAELLFGIDEPRWGRFGGSIRTMSIYTAPDDGQDSDFTTFPMQMDAYGQLRFGNLRVAGSLGLGKVPAGSPHVHAAQITTAQGDELNLISRNHWIGYDIADGWLIRAGRINLPFGMRVPEHVMWAREATRTDRESDQHHGVAVSYAKQKWRAELMGIVGNYQVNPDDYRERGYSFHGEYVIEPWLALGISSLYARSQIDRITTLRDYSRQAHGITGRVVPFDEMAVLAEFDLLKNTDQSLGYTSMVQAWWEFLDGVHAIGTFEALDTGSVDGTPAAPGVGEPRFGGWLSANWFFYTHFDVRVDAVVRQDDPFRLQMQGHFYF